MAKMIAIDNGFYNGRYIKKGEIFDYHDKEPPRKWMSSSINSKPPAAKKDDKTPSSLSDLTKQTAGQMGDSPRDGLA